MHMDYRVSQIFLRKIVPHDLFLDDMMLILGNIGILQLCLELGENLLLGRSRFALLFAGIILGDEKRIRQEQGQDQSMN